MASPPSESNARSILDIYASFEAAPGLKLISNNVLAIGTRRRIKPADLQSGINYAKREGWIAVEPDGALRLTDSGYERMRAG